MLIFVQEGLKAHEGGQQHYANPFDMFQNFFGGGRKCSADQGYSSRTYRILDPGAQTRRGPTSISEMEVSLADMLVFVYSIALIYVLTINLGILAEAST